MSTTPQNWSKKPLSRIAIIKMGQSPPGNSISNNSTKGVLFYQGSSDFGEKYPIPRTFTSKPMKIVDPDTILISVRAPVGQINMSRRKSAIGRGLAGITPIEGIDTEFLYQSLRHFKPIWDKLSTGSTFKAINRTDMERFEIYVPPRSEQQKIATILSSVDEAIDKTLVVIAKTERLKKGLMQLLLTRGMPGWHSDWKESKLGEIPKCWKIIKLSKVVNESDRAFVGGPFGSDLKVSDYTDEGIRVIQLQNIGNGQFNNNNIIYTSEKKYNELINNTAKPGDIVVAKMADPVARACIVPNIQDRWIISADCVRIRVDANRYSASFVKYLINDPIIRRIAESRSTGSTRLRIGLVELKKLPFLSLKLNEQEKIVSILNSVENKVLSLKSDLNKYKQIKKGLMQQLLAGKIRVKFE